MGRGADHTGPADRHQRQSHRVVAGVIDQIGRGDHLRRRDRGALGVLDRDDPGMSGDLDHRRRFHRDAGPVRDVVDHDRQRGGFGNGQEMVGDRVLGRPAVVGGDHQQPVHPDLLGLAGQLQGVRGIEGAHPGDHFGSIADLVDDGLQQRPLFGVGGGRRLTGGAVDHQAVIALGVDQVCGQPPGLGEVQRSVGGERRDHRGLHPTEGQCCPCHGRQLKPWRSRPADRRPARHRRRGPRSH